MPRSVLTSLALRVEVFALKSRNTLEHGGKKAIGVVQMWPKPQTLAGVETDPVFSPDGSQIAFTGEYEGNVDLVLPVLRKYYLSSF